jgi:hypothetical protein
MNVKYYLTLEVSVFFNILRLEVPLGDFFPQVAAILYCHVVNNTGEKMKNLKNYGIHISLISTIFFPITNLGGWGGVNLSLCTP